MLLNFSSTLPSGLRVHLRLPHGRDRAGLVALHARLGMEIDALDAARLLAHDPRRRAAVCAEAFTADGPALVGFAAGAIGGAAPDVLLVEPADADALRALLTRAIAERAGAGRAA